MYDITNINLCADLTSRLIYEMLGSNKGHQLSKCRPYQNVLFNLVHDLYRIFTFDRPETSQTSLVWFCFTNSLISQVNYIIYTVSSLLATDQSPEPCTKKGECCLAAIFSSTPELLRTLLSHGQSAPSPFQLFLQEATPLLRQDKWASPPCHHGHQV